MNLSQELENQLEFYEELLEEIRALTDDAEDYKKVSEIFKRYQRKEVNLAVFGETNAGKSSLLNALFGRDNNTPEQCFFKKSESPNQWSREILSQNGRKRLLLSNDIIVNVYDTPGIFGDFAEHTDIAWEIANNSDIILYVVSKHVVGFEVPELKKILLKFSSRVIVVINKIDILKRSQIDSIKADLVDKFGNVGFNKDQIIECSADPLYGEIRVSELVKQISCVVQAEYVNLVKSALDKGYGELLDKIRKKIEEKENSTEADGEDLIKQLAGDKESRMFRNHAIIHSFSVGAATSAFFLAPLPGGDEITLSAITTTMIGSLCANYKQMQKTTVIACMGIVSGALIGKMLSSYLYRFIPVFGGIINSGVTAGLHEAQGWLIVSYLENGLFTAEEIRNADLKKMKEESEALKKDMNKLANKLSRKERNAYKEEAKVLRKEAKAFEKETSELNTAKEKMEDAYKEALKK